MTTFKKAILKGSDDQTNFYKYRIAANFTNYNIISKLIITKLNMIRQLFHVINVCKNGRMDFWVTDIDWLRFLHCTKLS